VFGQHPVGDAHNVGGDPISRQPSARKPPVDDDKVVLGHDHAWLVLKGRWRTLYEIEKTFAARLEWALC